MSLPKASTGYVTVNFTMVKATAVGADSTGKSGTLSFVPGVTSMNVKVAITPETVAEGNETFAVTLSREVGNCVSQSPAEHRPGTLNGAGEGAG